MKNDDENSGWYKFTKKYPRTAVYVSTAWVLAYYTSAYVFCYCVVAPYVRLRDKMKGL